MPQSGILTITDCVFDEGDSETGYSRFKKRWDLILEETNYNKFWISLNSLNPDSVRYSKDYAKRSETSELKLGERTVNRDNEYLVTTEWIEKTAKDIGYTTLLNYKVNCFADAIVVLKK